MKVQLDGNLSDLAIAVGTAITLRNDKVISFLWIYFQAIDLLVLLEINYNNIERQATSRSSNRTTGRRIKNKFSTYLSLYFIFRLNRYFSIDIDHIGYQ